MLKKLSGAATLALLMAVPAFAADLAAPEAAASFGFSFGGSPALAQRWTLALDLSAARDPRNASQRLPSVAGWRLESGLSTPTVLGVPLRVLRQQLNQDEVVVEEKSSGLSGTTITLMAVGGAVALAVLAGGSDKDVEVNYNDGSGDPVTTDEEDQCLRILSSSICGNPG